MIKIIIKVMNEFYNKVNIYFRIKNDISYLKMTYEEILFLIYFTDKKKYFRVKYKKIINFKLKKLFIKGINTIKQGQSHLFKFIKEKIMKEAIDINNLCLIYKIVKDTLKDASLK